MFPQGFQVRRGLGAHAPQKNGHIPFPPDDPALDIGFQDANHRFRLLSGGFSVHEQDVVGEQVPIADKVLVRSLRIVADQAGGMMEDGLQ